MPGFGGTRRTWSGFVLALAFSAPLSSASLAHAQQRTESRFVIVSSDNCAELRIPEIERVLSVELEAMAKSWSGSEPLGVEISCEGATVRIVASDPLTEKRLSRDVRVASMKGDRDRTVALLISQLFLSSWSELLLREREVAKELPPLSRPVPRAQANAARGMAREALGGRAWRPAIAIGAGPRLRALTDAPVLAVVAFARPMVVVGPQRFFLELAIERGSKEASLGSVRHLLASAALGASWRFPARGALALDVGAMAGASYVDVAGNANTGAVGTSASGVVGEASIFAGPSLSLGVARVGLELAGGTTFPRIVGRVSRGDDVTVSGLWAGARLVSTLIEESP